MAKNKLVISLGVDLSAKQRQRLHKALHKTVSSQLKKLKTVAAKRAMKKAAAAGMTVHLHADFSSTNPGLSEFKAILNDDEKTLDQSGTVSFDNVQSGDIIAIQVDSDGSSTITIDVSADPTQFNFGPGNHNGNFFID